MNRKGFVNTVLVFIIVILIGAVGYFVLIRKRQPQPNDQLLLELPQIPKQLQSHPCKGKHHRCQQSVS